MDLSATQSLLHQYTQCKSDRSVYICRPLLEVAVKCLYLPALINPCKVRNLQSEMLTMINSSSYNVRMSPCETEWTDLLEFSY